MMKTSTAVKDIADKYAVSIARSLKTKVIDTLITKREAMDIQIFDLKKFNLETDQNKGQNQMTKDECESRFEQIIQLEFDIKILDLEIEVKQASFDSYFTKGK